MNKFQMSWIGLVALLSSCTSQPAKPAPGAGPSGVPLIGQSQMGSRVSLADRSNWFIQPVGQGQTLYWAQGDPIRVMTVGNPSYPYILINARTGRTALARFAGRS